MDLLNSYGSDGSDGEEDNTLRSDRNSRGAADSASIPTRLPQPPSVKLPAQPDAPTDLDADIAGGSNGSLWSRLPQPSTSTTGLAGLPPPATDRGPGRKVVTLQLPFRKELLAAALDSDDDEEPVAKRIKTTGTKSRLMDFLPPPKHDKGAGMFGSLPSASKPPAATASAPGPNRPKSESAAPGTAPASTLPSDFFTEGAVAYSNEAFRVRDDDHSAYPGPGAQPGPSGDSAAAYGYGMYGAAAYEHAAYTAQPFGPGPGLGPAARYPSAADAPAGVGTGPSGPSVSPDLLLEEALRAEQERASKRGGGGGGGGVKLVEINAKDLTHMDPASREAANSARDALGSDYALSLRRSAAPFEGSKMAKRKHQIGTLLFNARMQELDAMEKRTQGQKSKAETAAKYGW